MAGPGRDGLELGLGTVGGRGDGHDTNQIRYGSFRISKGLNQAMELDIPDLPADAGDVLGSPGGGAGTAGVAGGVGTAGVAGEVGTAGAADGGGVGAAGG